MTGGQIYLTQSDIESQISRFSAMLEETTDEFGKALNDARETEGNYRIAYARSFTTYRMGEAKLAEKTADQMAVLECADLLKARLGASAIERYLEEKLRVLRSQLDAVRTLSANVRAQT